MKATAKPNTVTNVKPMSGGGAIDTLSNGEYVYGDLSPLSTDIVNVLRIYRPDGSVKRQFVQPCKVFIGTSLTLVNETEPATPNDPVPPSEFAPALIVQPEGSTQKARYVFERIIE